jgi:hypothetical protein
MFHYFVAGIIYAVIMLIVYKIKGEKSKSDITIMTCVNLIFWPFQIIIMFLKLALHKNEGETNES